MRSRTLRRWEGDDDRSGCRVQSRTNTACHSVAACGGSRPRNRFSRGSGPQNERPGGHYGGHASCCPCCRNPRRGPFANRPSDYTRMARCLDQCLPVCPRVPGRLRSRYLPTTHRHSTRASMDDLQRSGAGSGNRCERRLLRSTHPRRRSRRSRVWGGAGAEKLSLACRNPCPGQLGGGSPPFEIRVILEPSHEPQKRVFSLLTH